MLRNRCLQSLTDCRAINIIVAVIVVVVTIILFKYTTTLVQHCTNVIQMFCV